MTMIPNNRRKDIGSGLNPNRCPRGVKGKMSVTPRISRVEINKYFPGLLLKKDLRVRMMSTMTEAEMTDSRNQPVLN
jgi:hypothetical protein